MRNWAVFDIDGTLLPGSSVEARFRAHLRRERSIPYRNLMSYFLTGFMDMWHGQKEDAFKSNKIYLKGIPADSLRESARNFISQHIIPLLSADGLKTIEQFRQQRYKIMLLSGSLDILVNNFKEICNPDYIVCSELEICNHRFTGRIIGLHPYALRKKQILMDLEQKLEIDFDHSVVFANDASDVHHMDLFGEAVAVNPAPELAEIAQKRDWRIEQWG